MFTVTAGQVLGYGLIGIFVFYAITAAVVVTIRAAIYARRRFRRRVNARRRAVADAAIDARLADQARVDREFALLTGEPLPRRDHPAGDDRQQGGTR